MPFVPGFDCVVELGATPTDVSAQGRMTTWTEQTGSLDKTTFGSQNSKAIQGITTTTFRFEGHVNSTDFAALVALKDQVDLEVSVEVGDAGGAQPAGVYDGLFNKTSWEVGSQVDSNWTFALEMSSNGPVTYTPPV